LGYVVIVSTPNSEPREVRLVEGETHIGRDPASVLVLEGRGVSRRHAKFVLSGDRLTIVDLGSTYGTKVNDVTTLRRDLVAADVVLVGMNKLTIKEVADPAAMMPTIRDANMPPPSPYFSDDVTQAPSMNSSVDIHDRKTTEMNRNAIQFVLDNPSEAGQAVKVLPRHDSDLMKAVQRLGAPGTTMPPSRHTVQPRSADYQALLLMYKISELLAAATDLQDFVGPMADLILEEVRADTVVLLMLGDKGELVPQVIRHRGALNPGEIPVSRSIIDRVLRERVAVMSNDVGHDDRLKSGQSVMLYKIRAVVAMPLTVRGEPRGVLYLSRSGLQAFSSADSDLLSALVSLVASGIERAELKDRVVREKHRRKALERFHPPDVVDRLSKGDAGGEDSLDEHLATVLICDLQGFPSLVERVPPRQLATVLHEYYEMLYEKVFANGGSLVKLHDGWALALFGSPHTPDKDAVWAIEAAIELCDVFTSIAVLWPESQNLAFRCALDTGTVVAGVVGSADRMEYAAIGQPISMASMMVRQAQGTGVWISERTLGELPRARYRVESTSLGDLRCFCVQR
jgi:adenylate cyclase